MAENICCDEAKAEMQKHFDVVAREISHHWKELGRILNLGYAAIENIDADYPRMQEKASQLLNKWFEKNGRNSATKEELCKALHGIERTDIAEMICCSDLKNHAHDKKETTENNGKKKPVKARPVSENIPRCTSLVLVQRRCATCSKNEIADLVLEIRNKKRHADNPVTDEGDKKTEDEESELTLVCPTCRNCLNLEVEIRACGSSENQQSKAEESSNCAVEPTEDDHVVKRPCSEKCKPTPASETRDTKL